jgi:AcrR family transcriptional regulator
VADTRERILDTTAELFRRYGYTGTGLKQIVAEANAPFGSIYHFFPGGKQHLGEAVIRRSGEMYRELFEVIFDASPDPVTGMRNFFLGAAETLRVTDYADACPIETVALEVASSNEPLRQATADVFESWIATGTDRLVKGGITGTRARRLTIAAIAALEGAFVLSRAMRSTEPLEIAGAAVAADVRAALQASRQSRRRTAGKRRRGTVEPATKSGGK